MPKRSIQKQFTTRLSIAMMTAMLLTVILIFGLQTLMARREAQKTESVQLAQAIAKIESNNRATEELKEGLNAEAIAKANAFSFMVEENEDILFDQVKLDRIKTFLNVDELHVTDEKGVLSYGTEPEMFGFDFGTNEQTRPFLEGMTNKSFVLAQEPQANATKGILFQYVGVARQDAPGVVQIGLRPERLEASLKNNEVGNVLSGQSVGQNGYVFAVDTATGNFLAHPSASLIGTSALEAGLPSDAVKADKSSGFITLNNEKLHYSAQVYDTMLLGAVLPSAEVYGSRNTMTLVFFISTAVIFLFLIGFISRLLRSNVTEDLHTICNDLERITGGDTDVVVSVRTNEEFELLSDGINEMVVSIRHKMEESHRLAQNEVEAFGHVKTVSGNIHAISGRMLSVSAALTSGVQEQMESTDSLSGSVQEVTGHISATTEKAQAARELSVMIGEQLKNGNREMNEMVASMGRISEQSNRIRNINKSIEDIAFQTNILALNAAVEAARAGDAGKGFSVVAEEVRNLAGKSAQSAKDTTVLIDETMAAVQMGADNAQKTAKTLTDILENAMQSSDLVEDISSMAVEQLRLVSIVKQEMEHIAGVVASNTATAKESENSATELSAQMQMLETLVGDRK